MSEQLDDGLENVHATPPMAIEQLLPISAEQALYDSYAARIGDFAGFRQRSFAEARDDFVRTMHEAQDGHEPDFLRSTIHNVITAGSYEEFKTALSDYWQSHGLEQDLANYSYCLLTNHRFFSDLPVCATVVRDMRHKDPSASTRNVLVVGRLIPGMEVDIVNNGNYTSVTYFLSLVARQLQTSPGLPEHATRSMKSQIAIWNDEAKHVLGELAATPGNIVFEAGSGTHDKVTDKGKKLVMQHANPETTRLLCSPRLKIIPLFFSCNSFSEKGLQPADAKYKFMPPRILSSPEDVHATMREIAQAGNELLADEFPNGVVYARTIGERVRGIGRSAL